MKIILSKELEDSIQESLKSLPNLESYAWNFDFRCDLEDEEIPVVINITLRKKNN